MGMFSRFQRKDRPQTKDAKRVYAKLMTQSRLPVFYGEGWMPDTYEGRIELLTLHTSIIMYALRQHGERGEKLSQAIFDVMVDDFDAALRGEGLTDAGVRRRIKPIVKLFYARLKTFTEGLNSGDLAPALESGELVSADTGNRAKIGNYALALNQSLGKLSLGDIALAKFLFPEMVRD